MLKLETIKGFLATRHTSGELFNNILSMSFGFAVRTGVQVAYFIIIARTLKPEAYGAYAGALALVVVLSSYVSWGSGNILIKQVSRQPERFPEYWGMALSVTVLSAALMLIVAGAIGALLLSPMVAWNLIIPIALGSFFGESFAILSSQAYQAHQRLSRTSLIWVLLGVYRLVCALLLLLLPVPKTAQSWAIFFMISGFLPGFTGLIMVKRELGWGHIGLKLMHGRWREGFSFAIGLSAQGAYNDIDKTLLVRLATELAAGTYAAAYRIIDSTFIPIRAMLYAGYPRFFQTGEKGIKESSSFALRLLPWAGMWGIAMGLGIPFIAYFVPVLLGNEYAVTSQILLWLTPIPLCKGLHNLAADALTGAGFQGLRSGVQMSLAILNLGLNLLLIPRYSWLGAAWSSLISDGLLVVSLWGLCFILVKRTVSNPAILPNPETY